MCAIFGSYTSSMTEVLYDANKSRGNFASSIVQIAPDDQYIFKKEGNIDFDKLKYSDGAEYFMGHVQAPTSAERDFHYETSHPFETMSWMIFHNGVIANDHQIRVNYIPYMVNPVDSSLIVNLIQHFMEKDRSKKPNPIKYIKQALEVLDGTFALSIVDCDTSEIYLARVGSILYYNNSGAFSTLSGEGFKEVPEGTILRLNKDTKRFNKVGSFKHSSPFMFI